MVFRCALVAQIGIVGAAMIAAACSDDAASPKKGSTTGATQLVQECNMQEPTGCPTPAPTYNDIVPLLQSSCVSCHNGDVGGPWPLTTYEHVSDWGDNVRSDLVGCTMPPADAGITMSAEDRGAILAWIRCGMPK